jgi:hypothetical protein
MTKTIHAAAIACVLVLSLVTSNGLLGTNYIANATSHFDEKPRPFYNDHDDHFKKNNICPSQSFLVGPGKGATKILDITYTAQNDEDSGITTSATAGGYWAIDHFDEHLIVWKLTDGSFYALKTYDGVFVVPTGGTNPGNGTKTQTESSFGSVHGGYVATFTGTFTPGTNPTRGNIGTFNYDGTMSDILQKIYSSQTGAPNAYDWTTVYFSGLGSSFNESHWGWSYKLDSEFQSNTSVNQWCNYNSVDGGNSGDILT